MKRKLRSLSFLFCAMLCAVSLAANDAADAQSKSMFTLNDFKYFKGVTMLTQTKTSAAFVKPTETLCAKHFGKAQKRIATKKAVTLSYDFGTARFKLSGDEHDADFVLSIKNAKLAGPRGLKVGDSYQTVLAAFRNDKAGQSLLGDGGFTDLYYAETNFAKEECAVRSGFVQFDEISGKMTAITYLHDFGEDNWGMLQFRIKNEKVTSIEWQFKISTKRLPIA